MGYGKRSLPLLLKLRRKELRFDRNKKRKQKSRVYNKPSEDHANQCYITSWLELAPSYFQSTDKADSACAAEIHVAISSVSWQGGCWPRAPSSWLSASISHVRQRVQICTCPFSAPTFYETDLFIILAWSEWVDLGINSPHRISDSGLHMVCSPSVLQHSCLLGKYEDLGSFCKPLPSSDTVSESLHCLRQILRFFSCQAFNHWPQLGLLPGCLNSLLARWKHLLVRSQSALHLVVLMYFPHNCDSTGCRGFSVGLAFPVYAAGSLKESLELRACERSPDSEHGSKWVWGREFSTQRPDRSMRKRSAVHLVNLWNVCRFSPFFYSLLFFLPQNNELNSSILLRKHRCE